MTPGQYRPDCVVTSPPPERGTESGWEASAAWGRTRDGREACVDRPPGSDAPCHLPTRGDARGRRRLSTRRRTASGTWPRRQERDRRSGQSPAGSGGAKGFRRRSTSWRAEETVTLRGRVRGGRAGCTVCACQLPRPRGRSRLLVIEKRPPEENARSKGTNRGTAFK